ncbi:glucosamine-6-phosphate deaminase [Dermabacter hominis]|mgnify:FL=1|uniref:glucosamine-6-phosphate deaminase n=1 Tax=Dermabacter hominis TaxID=36740 RepID=UPI00242F6706|nr:glucosamine-6-phosphate deaminase [Dermabacter hominis]
MEIYIRPTADDASVVVADHIEAAIREADGGPVTLGLATGSSPIAAYDELARRHRDEGLSFANVTVFMLDEYVGLSPEHPQSYARFIREHLVEKVDLDPAKVFCPRGDTGDPVAESARYDAAIKDAGGVDLQLLGVGATGHIGFNEPGTSLASRTHLVTLTPKTIADNSRFFDSKDDVPIHAISQGVGTIREARKLLLIATGENKAEAVRQTIEGGVSARWTSTALQLHEDATIVVDSSAASKLDYLDYYRFIDANRPERK